jgi:hypothetical protein
MPSDIATSNCITDLWSDQVIPWVNNNHHVAGKDMCVGFLCIRV